MSKNQKCECDEKTQKASNENFKRLVALHFFHWRKAYQIFAFKLAPDFVQNMRLYSAGTANPDSVADYNQSEAARQNKNVGINAVPIANGSANRSYDCAVA